jgi:hypothetical protein
MQSLAYRYRKAGLTDTPRPGERHEPHVRLFQ